MKKLLSIMSAVVLALTCFTATAFANPVTTVSVSGGDAAPGDEVTVSVSISGNTGFAAYNMDLNYGNDLELTAISAGEKCTGGMFVGNAGTGKVAYSGAANVEGDGVLFTATFKVLDDAAVGDNDVSVNITKLIKADRSALSAVVSAGTVSVVLPHACDFSGDWEFDASNHWKLCSCGETDQQVAHGFGGWVTVKDATETEDGFKKRECSTCGYTETGKIPATGGEGNEGGEGEDPVTPPADDPSSPEGDKPSDGGQSGVVDQDSSKDSDKKGDVVISQTGDSTVALAIGVVALLVASAAGMFFARRMIAGRR